MTRNLTDWKNNVALEYVFSRIVYIVLLRFFMKSLISTTRLLECRAKLNRLEAR